MTKLPLRFFLLRPVAETVAPASFLAWFAQGSILRVGLPILLALVFLNAAWIYRSRRRTGYASSPSGQAFSSLASIEVQPASIQNPEAIGRDLLNEFNDSLQAIQKGLNTIHFDKPLRLPQGGDAVTTSADMEALSQRARILGSFSADASLDSTIQKLSDVLQGIFATTISGVLFLSAEDQCFRGQIRSIDLPDGSPRIWLVGISQSSSLGTLLRDQGSLMMNSPEDFPPDETWLKSGEIKNLFLLTVSDPQHKKLGVLVLANKSTDFGPWDQERMDILQEAVSRLLSNLLQCEGYRQIDSLRRQYCRELFGLLEDPLNRIKAEVQSIFSRLGKLTPYYKEHCEQILFEVGKLYEIAHEASSLEDLSPRNPPERSSSNS